MTNDPVLRNPFSDLAHVLFWSSDDDRLQIASQEDNER